MKKKGLVFFLFVYLFYSCEYDKDFIYTSEVIPPQEDFDVEINLSDVSQNSTIYIYQSTLLTFGIDTKGYKILSQKITIDGNTPIDIYDNRIYLYPLNDNSTRKLVFDIELETNTGSIAEKMGDENYIRRYEYNLKFVKLEENFNVNFQGKKTDGGYLQLYWNEPEMENATFQKYELTFFNDITRKDETHIITDPKQNSFIDEGYVWGHRTYRLHVYYKNKDVDYTSLKSAYFTPDYYGSSGEKRFSYEYIDHEWMNVSWDYTGYKCKYLLVDANGEKFECDEDRRTVKIQRFRFPADPQRFVLYVLPYQLPYDEYKKCQFINVGYRSQDERYFSAKPPAAWNIEKDEYYFFEQGLLNIHSISDFSKKKDVFLRPLYSADPDRFVLSATPTTSQIAIFKNSIWGLNSPFREIFIYNVGDFENPLTVRILNIWEESIFLGDNYRLFYRDGVWDENGFFLYTSVFAADSRTGEVVASKKMIEGRAKVVGSSDGKYICEYYEGDCRIYKFDNDTFTLIHSYQNEEYSYEICQFSYTHPNELIISGGNETIVFDVTTLSEKQKMKGLFVVQDPKTGNWACLDESFQKNSLLVVYNNTFDRVLTKIPYCRFNSPHYFMNNRLIIYAPGLDAALDISDYIK